MHSGRRRRSGRIGAALEWAMGSHRRGGLILSHVLRVEDPPALRMLRTPQSEPANNNGGAVAHCSPGSRAMRATRGFRPTSGPGTVEPFRPLRSQFLFQHIEIFTSLLILMLPQYIEIASTGHSTIHSPQPMHLRASITATSLKAIAPTGQHVTHSPQPSHCRLSTCATM